MIANVGDIEDRLLPRDYNRERCAFEASKTDIHYHFHLSSCSHPGLGQSAKEISVPFSTHVDKRVQVTFEHRSTWEHAFTTVEYDRLNVAEIPCWLAVPHIYGGAEVEAVLEVNNSRKVGASVLCSSSPLKPRMELCLVLNCFTWMVFPSSEYRCPTANEGTS